MTENELIEDIKISIKEAVADGFTSIGIPLKHKNISKNFDFNIVRNECKKANIIVCWGSEMPVYKRSCKYWSNKNLSIFAYPADVKWS